NMERQVPPWKVSPTWSADGDMVRVKPVQVVEVEFAEWPREGVVRKASFIAQRSDKPAKDIDHESPLPAESLSPPRRDGKVVVAGVAISNPQRVIDPESGGKKQDLARYYADIAEWILPFLNEDRKSTRLNSSHV